MVLLCLDVVNALITVPEVVPVHVLVLAKRVAQTHVITVLAVDGK